MRRQAMVGDRIVPCRRRLIPRRSRRGIHLSRLEVAMGRVRRRQGIRLREDMVVRMRLLEGPLRVLQRMDDLVDWRVRWMQVVGVRLS